ncbi:MAG: NAD(P)/FAD-dependent oxidoreductase [Bacteroidales bacterium]|nr:NAD(P)/FAD-dependent oxidoreductase [Bacteroidales bacterium]MBK7626226.1 NAD(P)/FAD-dependent oxidoreductase [Bacteroidales bacterium]
MIKQVQINLVPSAAADEAAVKKIAASLAGLDQKEISALRIIKRSVDARKKNIRVNLTVELISGNDTVSPFLVPFLPKNVTSAKEVIIVGAGPAGLFAALRLIELGLRPVILERGRDVSSRKIDIAKISREQLVNPDSNYCFGEGGAGTYSDGKLYTRSKKRGDNTRVQELLCFHGANENIMYEAHPHLGTDKLPGIISNIRKSIVEAGGQFILEKKVTDFILEGDKIKGVITSDNAKYTSDFVILATGHSARDIYEICRNRGIDLEMKPFAMGVRVEHPQELIDKIQYHGNSRGEFLPAASYNLAKQVDGRGVYSFCMCPGGFIVPSATSQEEVVVNGMSPSGRNSPYANSGIVVEIKTEDFAKYSSSGVLAGIEFQKELERDAWQNGGHTQHAPAQRLADFVAGESSGTLPKVSYFPGITSSPLHSWLPKSIGRRLRDGFRLFGHMMNGYLTNEAVVLGVESRTSSPVRIPRDPEKMNHIRISGLYPCGEGSGYAGGIVSSAIDGMRAAEAIAVLAQTT